MRHFCEKLAKRFLIRCHQLVGYGIPWRAVVEELASSKPKWEAINGNSEREQPVECRVCKQSFGGDPNPHDPVQVWIGTNTNLWENPHKILTATLLRALPKKMFEMLVTFPNTTKEVKIKKRKEHVRCMPTVPEPAVPEAPDSMLINHNLEMLVQQRLEILVDEGIMSKATLEATLASLPIYEKCNHDISDAATPCSNNVVSVAHLDFEVRSVWDLLRLFVPFSKPPHFLETWLSQDASNLTNFIMAIEGMDRVIVDASPIGNDFVCNLFHAHSMMKQLRETKDRNSTFKFVYCRMKNVGCRRVIIQWKEHQIRDGKMLPVPMERIKRADPLVCQEVISFIKSSTSVKLTNTRAKQRIMCLHAV